MKRLIRVAILTVAASGVLLPGIARAQSADDRNAVLCGRIDEHARTVEEQFSERLEWFRQTAQEQTESIVAKQADIDELVGKTREKYDRHLKRWFEKRKTDTDVDQQKLATFQAQVEALIVQQRQRLAQARHDFRQSVDRLIQDRQAAIEEQITSFRSRTDNAFTKAKTACIRGALNRQEFVVELRDARLAFAEFRRSQASFAKEVHRLADERKLAVEEIRHQYEQDFLLAYEQFSKSN